MWAVFTIALMVLFVSLISQNQDMINVRLFRMVSDDYPKWTVIVAATLFGAMLASLFFIVELSVLETRNIRLRQQWQSGHFHGDSCAEREEDQGIKCIPQ